MEKKIDILTVYKSTHTHTHRTIVECSWCSQYFCPLHISSYTWFHFSKQCAAFQHKTAFENTFYCGWWIQGFCFFFFSCLTKKKQTSETVKSESIFKRAPITDFLPPISSHEINSSAHTWLSASVKPLHVQLNGKCGCSRSSVPYVSCQLFFSFPLIIYKSDRTDVFFSSYYYYCLQVLLLSVQLRIQGMVRIKLILIFLSINKVQ